MKKKTILVTAISCLMSGASINAYAADESESYKSGKKIYSANCVACHQPTGQGLPGAFPPLAGSDYLMGDKKRALDVPLKGLAGKITVNGVEYNSAMPSFAHLSDQDIASVMTYIMNSWGNESAEITAEEVANAR